MKLIVAKSVSRSINWIGELKTKTSREEETRRILIWLGIKDPYSRFYVFLARSEEKVVKTSDFS